MTVILGQTFTGISIGAVLLLIALGLSLTFGQMNVINMAHGEFIMAGAYTTYVLQKSISERRALAAASRCRSPSLVAGALGALLEWLLHPPPVPPAARHAAGHLGCLADAAAAGPGHLRRAERADPRARSAHREHHASAATIADLRQQPSVHPGAGDRGRGRAVADAAADPAGPPDPRGRAEPGSRRGVRHLHLRASTGPPSSSAPGSPGVAGVALTLVGPIGPTMGTNIIIDAFLVIVVGGIGQLKGTVIVAFVLGVLQSVLEYSTTVSVAKVLVFVADRRVPPVAAPGPVHAAYEESGMTLLPLLERPVGARLRPDSPRPRSLLFAVAPLALSDFRLGLLAKYLCTAMVAVGIGLAWGRGGLLDARAGRVLRARRLRHGDASEDRRRGSGQPPRLHAAVRHGHRTPLVVAAVREPALRARRDRAAADGRRRDARLVRSSAAGSRARTSRSSARRSPRPSRSC